MKLKQNFNLSTGFSLLEVLISLGIFCIISSISFQYLQTTSLFRNQNQIELTQLRQFNLATSIIRNDLMHAINVHPKNMNGYFFESHLNGGMNNKILRFSSLISYYMKHQPRLKRIDYVYENNVLKRYQFFNSNPVNDTQKLESILFTNLEQLTVIFYDGLNWYTQWPNILDHATTLPKLIQFNLIIEKKSYEFIFEVGDT